VYLSFKQLLIRRSLFSRIGGFPSKWGPCGDFNWYMKAGLVANVAHLPDTWATWRVHPKQATDMTYGATAEYQRKVEEMILDAVATCEAYLPPAVLAGLKSHWLDWTRDITAYNRECRRLQRSGIRRRIYQLTQFSMVPRPLATTWSACSSADQDGPMKRRLRCGAGPNLSDLAR
jgi:hypothetical protein